MPDDRLDHTMQCPTMLFALLGTAAALQPAMQPVLRARPQLTRAMSAMHMPLDAAPVDFNAAAATAATAMLLADGDGGLLSALFDTIKNVGSGILFVGLVAIPLYYIYVRTTRPVPACVPAPASPRPMLSRGTGRFYSLAGGARGARDR